MKNMQRKLFHKSNLVILILVVLIGAIFAGCTPNKPPASSDNEMVTYTDMAGNTVKLKKNVNRIVLLRSKDIYLLASLLGDELPKKLVGWGPDLKTDDTGAYNKFLDKYPQLEKTAVTGSVYDQSIDPEQILKLKPDVVIIDKSFKDSHYISKFKAAGLPVLFTDLQSAPFDGPQKSLELLGQVLGKKQRADEIVKYANDRIDNVLSKIEKSNLLAPSVYIENGGSGPNGNQLGSTYGGTGNPKQYISWGAVLNKLKVNNVADGVIAVQQGPMSAEGLLKANPDVIVITGQDWTTPGSMKIGFNASEAGSQAVLRGYLNRPGWSTLSAVKNKRVYSVWHNTAQITNFAAIEALAKDFYPDEFKDLNPENDLQEFYSKFMPIRYSGVWMLSLK